MSLRFFSSIVSFARIDPACTIHRGCTKSAVFSADSRHGDGEVNGLPDRFCPRGSLCSSPCRAESGAVVDLLVRPI